MPNKTPFGNQLPKLKHQQLHRSMLLMSSQKKEDGETVKECWLEVCESLFENFMNKAEIITLIRSMSV